MSEKVRYRYQDKFSLLQHDAMYDSERRHYKAQKTIAVILDYLGQAGLDGRDFSLLDMGCSTGYMSHACVFRGNSATDSGVNRPPIPIESGHPRRRCMRSGITTITLHPFSSREQSQSRPR
jgi:hypothetical protein